MSASFSLQHAQDRILIIDFGSQFTQLIARRIRQMAVYCEIMPYQASIEKMIAFAPKGVILSGGPNSAHGSHSPTAPAALFESDLPILGICYGMQTMVQQLGGKVASCDKKEFGHASIHLQTHPLFDQLPPENAVWMSHGDQVSDVGALFNIIAHTSTCPVAAIAHQHKPWFGVQFHPEVTHTKHGDTLLQNFVLNICQAQATWQMAHVQTQLIANIREKVGTARVLLGLSGGVDSSVSAALIHQAIGKQLTCVFVDHGLLRWREREQVEDIFSRLGVDVHYVDAKASFYQALLGVHDPEQKRKVIGQCFIDAFQAKAQTLHDIQFLAQGTIYPDVIESAGGDSVAHTIKSHHNVGGLPKDMPFQLLEPLRTLFKDEVRALGRHLGLDAMLLDRHPFPGPGLGVRILGEIKPNYVSMLQKADAIFIDILRTHTARAQDAAYGLCQEQDIGQSWYALTSQAFAVFLPIKSVGVMGDGRTYDYVIALRAVQTLDFMTAHWAQLPYDLLAQASNRIINEVAGINRVVYDISGKPPATIEWE